MREFSSDIYSAHVHGPSNALPHKLLNFFSRTTHLAISPARKRSVMRVVSVAAGHVFRFFKAGEMPSSTT
jgi:hypothetical protein